MAKLPRRDKTTLIKARLRRQARFVRKLDRRYKWLAAGLFCFALFPVLSFFPEFTEKYYSQGLYVLIRWGIDYTLGYLPFSHAYFLGGLLIIYLAWKVYRFVRFNIQNRYVSYANRLRYTLLSLGAFAGKISVVFFITWGYNYWRPSIEDRMNFDVYPLGPQEIYTEANFARKMAVEGRKLIDRERMENSDGITSIDSLPHEKITVDMLPDNLEDHMRRQLNKVMRFMEYPEFDRIRCRIIDNTDFLKTFGYTAVYISPFGEAQVGANIPAMYRPFFVAHEMAHGYGFFDESTANFLAYLACEQSDIPIVRYSGRISHLLYVSHELWFVPMNYPDNVFFDLRINGTFSSTSHYNRMILLIAGWRRKFPLRLDGEKPKYRRATPINQDENY